MQQVNFVCDQEKCRIGHLDIADGQQIIVTPAVLWRAFVPEREDFRLIGSEKSGQMFKCPRCDGHVRVEGDPDSRPIILGNTVVQAVSVGQTGS